MDVLLDKRNLQTRAAGGFRACIAGEDLLAILALYLEPSQRFSAGNRSDKLQEQKVVEARSGLFLWYECTMISSCDTLSLSVSSL
jgi:hypothetical protein